MFRLRPTLAFVVTVALATVYFGGSAHTVSTSVSANPIRALGTGAVAPHAYGGLDCNGFSPIQHPLRLTNICTDIRGISGAGNEYSWGGHFYDNGHYIGHDEPAVNFLSSKAGSGNDVTWTETLGTNPTAKYTATNPGHDVSKWLELTSAPWFGMALCNGESYPLLPCVPGSDANAPACITFPTCASNAYPGAGSSFLEVQFYAPGETPFVDSISCDATHWCASLHINDLECTFNFVNCNPNCIEPTNFAFIQRNGVPTGPPSPQLLNFASNTPNAETLMMNSGDHVTVHIFDSALVGGGHALEVWIHDSTTGQTGWMQASAHNGFMATSIVDCSGTPFNYEPEYSSAARHNIVPWAALQTDIATEFEIGHFEPCSSVSGPLRLDSLFGFPIPDTTWTVCHGAYENTAPGGDGSHAVELSDALCYPAGDKHGVLNTAPDTVTGCQTNVFQNGDLDFDGSAYWTEWPTGRAATSLDPGSFVQAPPTSHGSAYTQFFVQTDIALSESTCSFTHQSGCQVPPPNAPGHFYPYWSRVLANGVCWIEFGNVGFGTGVNNLGKDRQYYPDGFNTYGYPEFIGPTLANTCA